MVPAKVSGLLAIISGTLPKSTLMLVGVPYLHEALAVASGIEIQIINARIKNSNIGELDLLVLQFFFGVGDFYNFT